MTYAEIMSALESLGNENTKKVLLKHGAKEPFWGVKVGDMKKLNKKGVKNNHELALQLYDSGNSDAMYFAGLIDDAKQVTEAQLEDWLSKAYWYYLSEFTVPWLAVDAGLGEKMGLKWIDSDKEHYASAGWQTLSTLLMVAPNDQLDVKRYEKLLKRVEKELQDAPNRVRHTMNAFVIAVGGCFSDLTDKAIGVGNKIGKVSVDMGGTACKVPWSPDYIQKMVDKGRIGRKKKMARC